ncbi:hypothetical protein [Roseivirga misakiensis]|uniref:ABC transporter ATPase n=1 Tax=Roseivirga misakiensis TaxID=1563681 RepID=A0A1E5T642_9BACT|nr:hypothetical protein [Roseivirga misakiensis]OEK06851.1 hypothetical protein BFP71_04125 [Roseivirga misakiensis]
MLTPFDTLSPKARIWIYQADRKITASEEQTILSEAEKFIGEWAAHGQALLASAAVFHSHFLVIATDENFNLASGCSIDSSFRFVQQLGSEMNIDFFQRTNIAFSINDEVTLIPMSKIKQEVAAGRLQSENLFFDNNISDKSELAEKWLVKADKSWLKRYFQTSPSVL